MSHHVLLRCAVAAVLPLAVVAIPATASAAPPTAATVDLGGLGGNQTFPSVINDRGHVAGQSETATGDYHAFLWRNGTMIDLGINPGGTFSSAGGMNERGQVVVYGDTATGSAAFVWKAGVRTAIPAPGIGQVRAGAINEAGTVIGSDVDAADRQIGFLWRNGTRTDLGTLVPALINDAGTVVGTVAQADGSHRVVRWVKGVRTNLGTIGAPGYGAPYLVDLTERGDVAAYAATDAGFRAYVRRAGAASWRALPGLPGATDVRVSGINEDGLAVGTSNTGPGTLQRAVTWRNNGPAKALPTLGGETSGTSQVNDRGDISGFSGVSGGGTHAVLWRRGVLVDLGPAGPDSFAGALNERGQTVGSAYTDQDGATGYRWTVTG